VSCSTSSTTISADRALGVSLASFARLALHEFRAGLDRFWFLFGGNDGEQVVRTGVCLNSTQGQGFLFLSREGVGCSGSGSFVQSGDEFAVGSTCRVEFLIAFLELAGEFDGLLYKDGDSPLQFVDVGWGAEPGFFPCLLAQ
jgi:hypothetical protein